MIYHAKDIGIIPDTDITLKLNNFLSGIKGNKDEKLLVFDKGTYYLNSDNAVRLYTNITNTMGKSEWKKTEKRNENKIGILISDLVNLTIDFAGSTIIVDGQMTNISVLESERISIKNLVIRTVNPDLHEITVMKRSQNYIDYRIDEESQYILEKNRAYFIGKDYKSDFYDGRVTAYWIAMMQTNNDNTITRVRHPLNGAIKLKEIAPGIIRAYYFIAPKLVIGNKYYLFENRRRYQGIFVRQSSDISLDNIEQNFNYGLAFVAQDTENITVANCNFRPDSNSCRLMASVADFMQVCMCRGKVTVFNNVFEGAGDDALNVHGIHFKVTKIKDNKILIKFCHRQTYGFCPFRNGDVIRFINTASLTETCSRFTVESAKLINEKTIEITALNPIEGKIGTVIENVSACPDLTYENNSIKRIVSRGILITTSGKVVVKNNKFIDTSMHSILISDDAKSWYESGNVADVLIENNEFKRCVGYSVQIKPENAIHKTYVHSNIKILNNTIDSAGEGGFYIKSAQVRLSGNKIIGKSKETYIKNSDVISE